jgi:hypothetical protein
MTPRTTLRLGGLAAAFAVSLALVSSASARPASTAYQSFSPPSQSGHGSGVQLHRSGFWVQKVGGSPALPAPLGPADRSRGGATVPEIHISAVSAPRSSAFDWTDAAIGALFGMAVAMMSLYAAVALRGRRGGFALRM